MSGDGPVEGQGLINVSWVGTAAFTVTAIAAAAAPDALRAPAVVVALVLFAAGCVCFLWGFVVAVGRSRTEEIGIGGLFFLAGSAPARARRPLLLALTVQIVVAFATAAVRPFTSLAFGILAPVFGLGVAGLWGARHGRFPRRSVPQRRSDERR